jgi:hypothetical protein
MATNARPPLKPEPTTAGDLLKALEVLQYQNREVIQQNRKLIEDQWELGKLAEKIAVAAEKTAKHTWWIALPIWIAVILALLTAILWMAIGLMVATVPR